MASGSSDPGKVLEEDKRSFFSILAPKVVKVELTVKEENVRKSQKREETEIYLSEEDFKKAEANIKAFFFFFLKGLQEELTYKISLNSGIVEVEMQGKNAGFLIGILHFCFFTGNRIEKTAECIYEHEYEYT